MQSVTLQPPSYAVSYCMLYSAYYLQLFSTRKVVIRHLGRLVIELWAEQAT